MTAQMQGNPTFDPAFNRLHNLHGAFQSGGANDVPNTIALAQLEAILALAFEQRTANLIALYSMDEINVQGMVDGAGVTSENWVDVTRQIKERLGLK